jgi:hypothetical protein
MVSCFAWRIPSCSLTTSKSHSLTILLEFGNELVALLHNIIVLLVLVVWSVGFDDALSSHAIDGTWNALGSNKLGKITGRD